MLKSINIQTGIIALMTVKGGIGKSAQKANDEIAALATELTR
jgi:MinD-like ATPase involved in chromosome partitioning or flagellar assembly